MSASKKSVMEGQSFIVTVKLVEPLDLAGSKMEYIAPEFKNFTAVPLGDGRTIEKESSVVRVIKYLLTPKSSGDLTIEPAHANIEVDMGEAQQSPFGFFGTNTEVKKLSTNSIKINVTPKPDGVDIVGTFLIKNKVEALTAKANKPFNYIIILHGIGNLDNYNLPEFKIPGLTIYNEDAKLEHSIEKGKLKSSYIKKFVFISDKDFTIPSVSVTTYDPKTKSIKVIKTKPYFVKVKRNKSITGALENIQNRPNMPKLDKITDSITKIYSEKNSTKAKKDSDFLEAQMLLFDKNYYKKKYLKESYPFSALIGSLILGIILGAGGYVLLPSLYRIITHKKSSKQLYENYEDALNILYPHTTKSKKIEAMVEKLYEVTNGNSNIHIDNHALNKLIKKVLDKQKL